MQKNIKQLTQLDQILTKVAEFTHSTVAAEQLAASPILTDITAVRDQLALTAEAHQLLLNSVMLTFFNLDDLKVIQTKLDQGMLLNATQLGVLGTFLTSGQRLMTTLRHHAKLAPKLVALMTPVTGLSSLQQRLTTEIKHDQVADQATPELTQVRQKISQQRQQVQAALTQFVQKHPQAIQGRRLITRNDHVCVQLKANYKTRFPGQIIDQSGTGSTVFFEPKMAAQRGQILAELVAEESAEVYQILATLTGDVQERWPQLIQNQQLISQLDQLMAKGQYALSTRSCLPALNTTQHLKIVNGRHPLLGTNAVPLNVELAPKQGLMITGANSGGKTVVLKTIALFAQMVQVGLEVPADLGTEIPVFTQIWLDIGDNQSLAAQLSTFAAEMTTLVTMTDGIQPNALVLLDEIGSGTDPEEGSALSIAIIDYLRAAGATIIATTHFSAIKSYAVACPTFVTATMAFDRKTLEPTYHLLLHQVGASEAIWLAERLGLAPAILTAARQRLEK
ncbi:hypothetical protein RA086_04940 [Lactiplantibacillus sp. WILCCON 0030]|uniref:DNA mismatch repair proteins mutS family domain-containing protein n=1 Tax=Lactiplantibacillus brownii TaxID=3069269 RepID=A0ABU1A7T5_9LACO|nr:hypothetical protein [Lactiplantibacillus brownii]MDQ7936989.1 hypothetical protein [Lactiplantibacillus brownii]